MPANFVNIDRDTPFLLPPDLKEWIADDDPVHFILEAVLGLDDSLFKVNRRGSGSKQYPPKAMLALLIYCYSRGIMSSRKIEQATYRDLSVRYLMAGHHPDHNTIACFRKNNQEAIQDAFKQVLLLANKLGMLKVGMVSVDGTHIKASASLSRNVRYDRAKQLIKKLEADIAALLQKAQAADDDDPGPDGGDALPKELARRQSLKAKLEQAKAQLEQEAKERAKAEDKQVNEDEVAAEDSTCKNLTDGDSRVMTKRNTTIQGYNAQAAVDADGSLLILSAKITQSSTDMGQLKPMVESIDEEVGKPTGVLADAGYPKINDLEALETAGLDLYVAVCAEGRREYDFRPESMKKSKAVKHSTLVAMKQKLETDEGKSQYRRRQETSEPVFGIIKEQLGFRQFHLRGREGVQNEWTLVSLAYNMKRMATLKQAA